MIGLDCNILVQLAMIDPGATPQLPQKLQTR
jgi:hypothetical protein